jgi:hypothetical protein
MPLQIWSDRKPVEIRPIAHDMINLGEQRRYLCRHPAIRAGAHTDDKELWLAGTTSVQGRLKHCRSARRVETSIPARQNDHGEVRHGGGIDIGHRHDTLFAGSRPLHIECVGEPSGLPQRLPYVTKGPAQFHDRRRVGVGQPARQLRFGQRSGQHSQDVLMARQRSPYRSGRGR